MSSDNITAPIGEIAIRTIAMPKDTNASGDIFGGWLMSQMDMAGGLACMDICKSRFTTVAVSNMRFWKPVCVGDTVCIHSKIISIGRSSITVYVNVWTKNGLRNKERKLVTDAEFVYVMIDENGRPVPVSEDDKRKALSEAVPV